MSDLSSVTILVPGAYNGDGLDDLKRHFDVEHLPDSDVAALSPERRAAITGIAQTGKLDNALIDALPHLEIIANFGVGYDGIDAAHAAARGVAVTNTPDVLTEEVADTALGLLLMCVRELGAAERHVRAGKWEGEGSYRLTPATLRGRTVGLFGLGRIGLAIARRLEGFGTPIHYHKRTPLSDVDYTYHDSLAGLAEAVDTLIVAVPGGAQTERMVDAGIFEALGETGILVNIGRGTTIDEPALVEALQAGTIQGAGLDVFEAEPKVPQALLEMDNVVCLPHVASASRHTRKAMADLARDNLLAWFDGRPPLTPVGETVEAGLDRR